MVCLGNKQRSLCHFWDCIQVLHFRLLLTLMATPFLLRDSCILSKSLIQFQLMGGSVFPPCRLIWGQTMVEVMKTMGTSFKRLHTLMHSVPPTLQQTTTNPCLCWRLLDTHGQVWVSLFWAPCSFLLGPGEHKVLFKQINKHITLIVLYM